MTTPQWVLVIHLRAQIIIGFPHYGDSPEKGNSSPRGTLTHSAHNAMHEPAPGCPMGSITGDSNTQVWQRSPSTGLTGYDVPACTIPADGKSGLSSFTRAMVPGGSLAANPSIQLQGGALDVGSDEVGARENPPQPQNSV